VDVGDGLYMYDVVVKQFTFAISSPDEFLTCKLHVHACLVSQAFTRRRHH